VSATTIALVALGMVDVAALCIGLSIRRKVVGIITSTGASIEEAVKAGIAEAAAQLVGAIRGMLAAGASPVATGASLDREELLARAEGLVAELRGEKVR